jgi:hypothetical protein
MKNRKHLLSLAVLVSLSALLAIQAVSTKRGSVDNLRQLPGFGRWLPSVDLPVIYEYRPFKSVLDAKFACDTNIFNLICRETCLDPMKYESGFRKDYLVSKSPEFMPDGERVWCALGILNPPGGRRTIELAYEPPSSHEVTNQTGMLYMGLQ